MHEPYLRNGYRATGRHTRIKGWKKSFRTIPDNAAAKPGRVHTVSFNDILIIFVVCRPRTLAFGGRTSVSTVTSLKP